ncbi:hypothetical protein [Pedobacter sp. GR22-10]|uniref:hypothetical protein n=1 Tax=Pedobacter sp. GR22-10 TaxID=2994472 RepID=UPI0022468764|nr:hypothetical protein [Pedobacter sp. GR22-10]MCX2432841.1 hypothetical protein [Pedobacter sp. GR22-10]
MRKKINANSSIVKTIGLFFLATLIIVVSCRKTSIHEDVRSSEILSKNAPDFKERLNIIKDQFFNKKLAGQLIFKENKNLSWSPDWDHPTVQIVNDTISYVFYPLFANLIKGDITQKANELGSRSYLIVKNEKEFYRGIYYYGTNVSEADQMKEMTNTKSFTGSLALTNLETKRFFVIDYKNGLLSDTPKKSSEILAMSNKDKKTAYYTSICHTEMRACTFFSSNCGILQIKYSMTCRMPETFSSCGGNEWQLTDYQMVDVCQQVWFPDPPIDQPGNNDNFGSVDLKSGDSFVDNDNIDKAIAKKFSSVGELNEYLSQVRNNLSQDAVVEKPGRIRYNVDGISGIDVNVVLNKLDNTNYTVKNATSAIWGLAPFMEWAQKDFSQNENANITRLEVIGYLSMNLVLQDFGKIYSMRINFIIDINNKTGEFVATKVKSFN